jgi:hypothetical protein
VVTTMLTSYDMVNVHLALICSTYLAEATIAHKHAFTLLAVTPTIQLI